MTNKDISAQFKLLASLMEMYEENSFKTKSVSNAYLAIRKANEDLFNLEFESLSKLPGIGKSTAEKIVEIRESGSMKALEDLKSKTPQGIIQMLGVRGLGPKKVQVIWKEMGIEDLSDLHLACTENRLVKAKGFGIKTQEDILNKIEFFQSNLGKMHYASVIEQAIRFLSLLRKTYPNELHELTGLLRRKMPEVVGIELLSTLNADYIYALCKRNEENEKIFYFEDVPVNIYNVSQDDFYKKLFLQSSSVEFNSGFVFREKYNSEQDIFDENKMSYVLPEYRESLTSIQQARSNSLPQLIELTDIKGCLHNHSTYSDGINTLEEMAVASLNSGMTYFGISDHSKSAFYANGLVEERVEMQWREIDHLNKINKDIKIFKSIECDILSDGSMDYDDDFLSEFDFVIASIHSNLRMDKEKATQRMLKAIEHPLVDMIGHPTGRLLLGRSGYELDMQIIMDACVANDVVIELNANPQRLDLDWTYIPYFISKGGLISINPDAHSKSQIGYIKYGIEVARKAGVTKENVLNAFSIDMFEDWVKR